MIAVASAFSNNDDDDVAEALMAIEHDDLLLASPTAESDGADRRGLLPERSPNKLRDFACGERGILRDCFGLDGRPLIDYKKVFERRGPLPRIVFDRVNRDVSSVLCFHQRVSATKKMQSYTLQKVAAALRVLVSGFPSDEVDEYARLPDSTINETVHRFTRNVLEKYKPDNRRSPYEQICRASRTTMRTPASRDAWGAGTAPTGIGGYVPWPFMANIKESERTDSLSWRLWPTKIHTCGILV